MTRKDFAQAESRPRYERVALGFVGMCVVGMYATAAFSPVKTNAFTMPLKDVLGIQSADIKAPPIMEMDVPYVFSMALPPESEAIVAPAAFSRTAIASLGPSGEPEVTATRHAPLISSVEMPSDSEESSVSVAMDEAVSAVEAPADEAVAEISSVKPADKAQPIEVASLQAGAQAAGRSVEISENNSAAAEDVVAFAPSDVPPQPAVKPSAPPRPKVYASSESTDFVPASYGRAQVITRPASGMSVRSSGKLDYLFASLDYSLDNVRHGEQPVPRVFLSRLPRDLEEVPSIGKRKALFLKAMLPLILQANETVLSDRRRLLSLRGTTQAGGSLSSHDQKWVKSLSRKYGLKRGNIDSLLKRVDAVPISLALAQAVEESGWGTSRFAQMGNAPFGQWTFDESMGMIPMDRGEGESHAVKSYTHLLEGVQAYIHNLNTHAAYRSFRQKRLDMRHNGGTLDGQELAETLTSYSERGDDYIVTLHRIMQANNLSSLDRARLNGAQMARIILSEG